MICRLAPLLSLIDILHRPLAHEDGQNKVKKDSPPPLVQSISPELKMHHLLGLYHVPCQSKQPVSFLHPPNSKTRASLPLSPFLFHFKMLHLTNFKEYILEAFVSYLFIDLQLGSDKQLFTNSAWTFQISVIVIFQRKPTVFSQI